VRRRLEQWKRPCSAAAELQYVCVTLASIHSPASVDDAAIQDYFEKHRSGSSIRAGAYSSFIELKLAHIARAPPSAEMNKAGLLEDRSQSMAAPRSVSFHYSGQTAAERRSGCGGEAPSGRNKSLMAFHSGSKSFRYRPAGGQDRLRLASWKAANWG